MPYGPLVDISTSGSAAAAAGDNDDDSLAAFATVWGRGRVTNSASPIDGELSTEDEEDDDDDEDSLLGLSAGFLCLPLGRGHRNRSVVVVVAAGLLTDEILVCGAVIWSPF